MSTVYRFGERPPTKLKARQVSFHEAGHIVAASMLGIPVAGGGFAVAHPRPDYVVRGLVRFAEPRSRADCRRRAAAALAGPVAEHLWFLSRGVAVPDVESLPSFAGDESPARRYLCRAGVDYRRADAVFAECLAEAEELLADGEAWESVRSVARQIRRQGWLQDYEITSAVW